MLCDAAALIEGGGGIAKEDCPWDILPITEGGLAESVNFPLCPIPALGEFHVDEVVGCKEGNDETCCLAVG